MTVYLPPNFVGLKMSLDTVAYAVQCVRNVYSIRYIVGIVQRAAIEGCAMHCERVLRSKACADAGSQLAARSVP